MKSFLKYLLASAMLLTSLVAHAKQCLAPTEQQQASVVYLVMKVTVEDPKDRADAKPNFGHGSGVVVADDWVLTARHVAPDDGLTQVFAYVDGRKYAVERTIYPETIDTDLALLYVPGLPDLEPQQIRRAPLQAQEPVWAVGYPLSVGRIVTSGLYQGEHPRHALIVSTTPIAPGNSGGALFGCNGELVGITTAVASNGRVIALHLSLSVKAFYLRDLVYTYVPGKLLFPRKG